MNTFERTDSTTYTIEEQVELDPRVGIIQAPESTPEEKADAFINILDEHLPKMKLAVSKIVRTNRGISTKDIMQTTILRAWRGISGFKPGPLESWLCVIASHCALDEIERQKQQARVKNRVNSLLPADFELVEDDFSSDGTRDILAQIDELILSYREVIKLKMAGLGNQDIAELLGIPEDLARQRLHRARMRLAKLLRQRGLLSGL